MNAPAATISGRAIKCFAAGTDRSHHALVLHALGYPYRLVSYYYLKEDARSREFVLRLLADAPEVKWIMDSGLFSLMFGAAKGTLTTFEDFQRYAVEYVATMRAWKWNHPIVECDIQRVRSVAETHRLRAEVFEPSGMDVIYVWHIPDGEEGLVAMARRYQRIAISIPELRQVIGGGGWSGGDSVKRALLRCMRLVERGGDPYVHLLGNTEGSLLGVNADSSDSTSWISPALYGKGIVYSFSKGRMETISAYSPKWKAWRRFCEREHAQAFALIAGAVRTPTQFEYYANIGASAISMLMMNERIARCSIPLRPPAALPVHLSKDAPEAPEQEGLIGRELITSE